MRTDSDRVQVCSKGWSSNRSSRISSHLNASYAVRSCWLSATTSDDATYGISSASLSSTAGISSTALPLSLPTAISPGLSRAWPIPPSAGRFLGCPRLPRSSTSDATWLLNASRLPRCPSRLPSSWLSSSWLPSYWLPTCWLSSWCLSSSRTVQMTLRT